MAAWAYYNMAFRIHQRSFPLLTSIAFCSASSLLLTPYLKATYMYLVCIFQSDDGIVLTKYNLYSSFALIITEFWRNEHSWIIFQNSLLRLLVFYLRVWETVKVWLNSSPRFSFWPAVFSLSLSNKKQLTFLWSIEKSSVFGTVTYFNNLRTCQKLKNFFLN